MGLAETIPTGKAQTMGSSKSPGFEFVGSGNFHENAPSYSGSKFAQPGELGKLFAYGSYHDRLDLEKSYAVIDLETSGFESPQAKILEIAILKIDLNGNVLEEFSTLIDPMDKEVGRTDIHGITLAMVKNAPTFAEAVGPILRMFQNSILVAHHAKFEENFLANELSECAIQMPLLPAIDTLWLSRQVLNLPNYKLETVIHSYNEHIVDAHTALGDVRAMAKVLPRMFEQSEKILFPKPFSELPKVFTKFEGKKR
jgi:DNA polymerase III alpha subunit (gram-positive type)